MLSFVTVRTDDMPNLRVPEGARFHSMAPAAWLINLPGTMAQVTAYLVAFEYLPEASVERA